MKKKILNKATVLFLAIMMVLTTFNFSIIASDYVDETIDMSVLDIVDESLPTEETVLLEELPVPVEELIMTADASSEYPPGTNWDDEFANQTLGSVVNQFGWGVEPNITGSGGEIMGYVGTAWIAIGYYDIKTWNGSLYYHFHITHQEHGWINRGRYNVHWLVSGW